jgi:ubiquinone/menaquinone biosynthesis C-methylase UbiE
MRQLQAKCIRSRAGTRTVALAAARQQAIVTATDITPRMVQLGRTRTATSGMNVTWALADVDALPFTAADSTSLLPA